MIKMTIAYERSAGVSPATLVRALPVMRPCWNHYGSRLLHNFFIPAVTVCLLIILSLLAYGEDRYEIHPKMHEGYEVKDDKIYFRSGNAGMILELADSIKIADYYKDRGSDIGNPFVSLGPDLQGATLFLLTLINHTHGDMTFTPGYVVLRIKDQGFFPMDFTVLMPNLDDLEQKDRKTIEQSVFHSPEVIRPGTAVAKFIIFPQLPTKFEEYKVAFDYLFFGNREGKMDFYFQRIKVKK